MYRCGWENNTKPINSITSHFPRVDFRVTETLKHLVEVDRSRFWKSEELMASSKVSTRWVQTDVYSCYFTLFHCFI